MNEDRRFPPKSVVLGARTGEAAVAVPLDKQAAGRLELEAAGEVFTSLHDAALETGHMFRGRSHAPATIYGSGPGGVSWSGAAH